MPELPEVFTVVSDLKKHVTGFSIKKVTVQGTYKTSITSKIHNTQIVEVDRIAKNILIKLNNTQYIHIHLAMTGQVLLKDTNKLDKFEKVCLEIEKNNETKYLKFCDMRMFGKCTLIEYEDLEKLRIKYGEEPINENADFEKFFKTLTKKKTTIKNALLDQSIISGLGNIYATDTLWLSKVHPETITKDISKTTAKKLFDNAKLILNEGISHRGSTLDDKMYVDIFGQGGTHQNYFRIYGKKQCTNCKNPTSFKQINGRGTYYCETCQLKDFELKLF